MLRLASIFTLLFLVSCSGSGGNSDAAAPADLRKVLDLTLISDCGHPGDKGNSIGVGKFCKSQLDCVDNTKATLCTQLDPDGSNQYFCTFMCKMDAECGEDARCACSGGRCGCFPRACDDPIDASAGN